MTDGAPAAVFKRRRGVDQPRASLGVGLSEVEQAPEVWLKGQSGKHDT